MQESLTQPIYHIGRQWAVTGFGIEEVPSAAHHAPYYFISKNDLGRGREWVRHMAEKQWVDVADFTRAFAIAENVHRPKKERR